MKRPTIRTPEPHPLEGAVLAAFVGCRVHDRVTLSVALKGVNFLSGRRGGSGDRAYLIVAEDVLGYMADQGKLRTDADGWYHLAGPLAAPGGDGSAALTQAPSARDPEARERARPAVGAAGLVATKVSRRASTRPTSSIPEPSTRSWRESGPCSQS